jgi:hypothetical protein
MKTQINSISALLSLILFMGFSNGAHADSDADAKEDQRKLFARESINSAFDCQLGPAPITNNSQEGSVWIRWEANDASLGSPPKNGGVRVGRPSDSGNGWAVNDAESGFMQYGPYTTEITSGYKMAFWDLKIINPIGEPSKKVLMLDVYDSTTGGPPIASRELQRRDWKSINTNLCFTLPFRLDSSRVGHRIELRIKSYGGTAFSMEEVGYIKMPAYMPAVNQILSTLLDN